MSERKDAEALGEARGLREEAWRLVRADIADVREGLNGRVLAHRVKDRAAEEIAEAVDQARDIASGHKSVVAGTILALLGWLFREPIFGLFHAISGAADGIADEEGQTFGDIAGDEN